MKQYEYPIDLWTTIEDENNKTIDINLFSADHDKYFAIYERENPKQMEFDNCIAHYKLQSTTEEMKQVTIIWGTEAVKGVDEPEENYTKKTYEFETQAELNAFLKGVDEGNGWLEYEVEE